MSKETLTLPGGKAGSQISTLDDTPKAVSQAIEQDIETPIPQSDGMSGKMEIVTIHSGQEDGGSDAVFIGHNGFGYQVPRDKPFKLPTEVVQILRDAVTTTYKPGAGGTNVERTMPRFQFTATPA